MFPLDDLIVSFVSMGKKNRSLINSEVYQKEKETGGNGQEMKCPKVIKEKSYWSRTCGSSHACSHGVLSYVKEAFAEAFKLLQC